MDFNQRQKCISGKLKKYTEEVSGLRGAGIGYQLGFSILLLILLPVILLEILIALLIGKEYDVDVAVFYDEIEETIFKGNKE